MIQGRPQAIAAETLQACPVPGHGALGAMEREAGDARAQRPAGHLQLLSREAELFWRHGRLDGRGQSLLEGGHRRIEALFFLYVVAVLLQAFIEREVRRAMKEEGFKELPIYPEEQPSKRPSAEQILRLYGLHW